MPIDRHTLAFLMVCGAGGSTCIGAALVYHPTYIQYASKRTLGGALGLSAGVMLYVSFIEIFSKSQAAFEDSGLSEADSYLYATLCFFFGFVLMLVLDKIVHMLDPDDVGHADIDFDMVDALEKTMHDDDHTHTHPHPHPEGSLLSTVATEEAVSDEEIGGAGVELGVSSALEVKAPSSEPEMVELGSLEEKTHLTPPAGSVPHQLTIVEQKQLESQQKLQRMGLVTALAIGIHNFPEGLATFVATLDDPAVGVALTVAIAIHNIPEGVCVAMPIFFATGNRHRAFLWAVISGVSEVVAAGLGWLVLSQVLGHLVYAILFGCVSGE
jgi:zinc transporter, ZIP family